LEYLGRLSKERLGLGILAPSLKQKSEIVVSARNLGMILTESLFVDLVRALLRASTRA
jgi:hypothetical protein